MSLKNNSFKRYLLVSLILVMNICSAVVNAQGTQASITGRVLDDAGEPLPGATVMVKNESTGFVTGAATNVNGEYAFRQLPLGSPYTVTASFVGFDDQSKSGYALNQSNTLIVDFALGEDTEVLEEVVVVANSLKNTVPTIGSATQITSNDMTKLPVNGRNFTTLVDLSPLSAGGSLSGQLGSSTNYTIDGMTARNPTSSGSTTSRNSLPYAISMEAIREFEIVTNQYDVTLGRAGGGTVSTVTKSGTNILSGSAFLYERADWLSSKYDMRGAERSVDFSTQQYGFSLGGPIVKDRAHFFVAWDHQTHSSPLIIADIRSDEDQIRYNISRETLGRFIDIARDKYGVADSPQTGMFERKRQSNSIFARIDWQLNPTSLLVVRNNFNGDNLPGGLGDQGTINLYEVYGDVVSRQNSFMTTLRSVFGPKITNELKFQHLYTSEDATPGDQIPSANIPRAIVRNVRSTVDGRELNVGNIQIGGHRYLPENFYNHVLQLVDNMYYNTGKIEYTFGFDLKYSHLKSRYGSETNGRFIFDGIEAFENMTPSAYIREVYIDPDNDKVVPKIMNTGIYAQMQTKLFTGFNLMAGIRMDYADYLNTGNFNQLVYDELKLRTDNRLRTFHFQPRIQLNWDINDKHTDILKAGVGIFASDINNYSFINNMVFDGTRVATVDITGANVPVPDFAAYRRDPSTAPGMELFTNPAIKNVPTINTNAPDAAVPVIYKANLSYTHFFSDKLKLTAAAYMNLARNNYMYVDVNMVDEPYFTLANEANRRVYVPANTITETGSVDWKNNRKTDKIGRVLEMNSEGKVDQFAFVVDGTWRYFRDGEISASYTWNDTRDNTTFNGDVANTATLQLMVADDPRDLSRMSYSNSHFRHKVVVYGTAPSVWGISVGVRYSGIGGSRYSMIVSGNVSGGMFTTNSANLAYVPDLNGAETPLLAATKELLANPDVEEGFKDYIRESSGKIAERNAGVNGFYGIWDIRLAKKIALYKKHALDLSVDIFNFANMLNIDWGSSRNLGNQAIYIVNSFDQAKKEFGYRVNPNAGVISVPGGTPWQIQLGARYSF